MPSDAKKDNWTTMASWSTTSGTFAEIFIENNAAFVYKDLSVEQELRKEVQYVCKKCGKTYPKNQEISGGFCSLDCKYSHCTLNDVKG